MRRTLIVIGPLPPPYHGVTVSTSLVLANDLLREHFDVVHLDTSDTRHATTIGRWDTTNVVLGLRAAARLAVLVSTRRRGVVYLPLSQNAPAFLRDSLFVHLASLGRWRAAAHLRGGEFDRLYREQPWLFRRWMRFTLARIDSMGVMGETLRTLFAAFLPTDRVAVVANGTPPIPRDGVERERGLVVFLSNMRRRKGIFEALEAATIVLEHNANARFVFAGTVEAEDVRAELAKRAANAGGRLEVLPSVSGDEKRRLLLRADVVLFPPILPEGHPRVILEALAVGAPIVTTDRGTIAETVRDGVDGFVLPEADPEALAERVLLLLEDDQLHSRMAASAHERYRERYTQEVADRRLAEWLAGV